MLSKTDIVQKLKELGLELNDKVLVHSSLGALGKVDGGTDAVIDALLEAVGSGGLVAVPTFACKAPFDRKVSTTNLGAIPDKLWRRFNTFRSLHPTHSIAAIGNGAEELIQDHEKAATAYGEDTPYVRLARSGGKILLMGVDQDRNTTLHAAEAIVHAPYLNDIQATYIDDNGNPTTIQIQAMAGPHRDFIRLDRLFREHGIMRIGRIGDAVCRLIDAGPMLDLAIDALQKDPAAVLCDNPECRDCVMQRGRIKAARLAEEKFTLAAVVGDISDNIDETLNAIHAEGINAVEITPAEYERYRSKLTSVKIAAIRGEILIDDAKLAHRLGVPLIVSGGTREEFDNAAKLEADTSTQVLIENNGTPCSEYIDIYNSMSGAPSLAFNPAKFAAAGTKPFLQAFYHNVLRKVMNHFYICDGTFDGSPALPGRGNGEIKEIISMLRCRSYDGVLTLRSYRQGAAAFRETASALWRLFDTM